MIAMVDFELGLKCVKVMNLVSGLGLKMDGRMEWMQDLGTFHLFQAIPA